MNIWSNKQLDYNEIFNYSKNGAIGNSDMADVEHRQIHGELSENNFHLGVLTDSFNCGLSSNDESRKHGTEKDGGYLSGINFVLVTRRASGAG